MNGVLGFVELLHNHLYGIWHFLVVVGEDFLADNFGDEKAGGLVGQGVFPEVWGRRWQKLHNAGHEVGNVEILLGRQREHLGVG